MSFDWEAVAVRHAGLGSVGVWVWVVFRCESRARIAIIEAEIFASGILWASFLKL